MGAQASLLTPPRDATYPVSRYEPLCRPSCHGILQLWESRPVAPMHGIPFLQGFPRGCRGACLGQPFVHPIATRACLGAHLCARLEAKASRICAGTQP